MIALVMLVGLAFGQAPTEAEPVALEAVAAGDLAGAAAAVEAGRPDLAVAALAPRVALGQSGAAYKYTLGTAYLREGDAPRALAALRAAGAQRPRDSWVAHNLALARDAVGKVPEPVPASAWWMEVMAPAELGLLALLMLGCGSLAALWQVVRRAELDVVARVGAALLWGAGAGLAGVAVWGAYELEAHPVAVVIGKPAAMRVLPEISAATSRTMPVGAELRVSGRAPGFVQVWDAQGSSMWVTDGAVEIVPR